MKKIILTVSIIFIVLGYLLSDFATEQVKAGDQYFIIIFWLPTIGLLLIWFMLIKYLKDRKKEDIRKVSVKLPELKPKICWDPKYQIELQFSSHFFESDSPQSYLIKFFESLNFKLKQDAADFLVFVRGSIFCMFSSKKAKIILFVQKPLNNQTIVYTRNGLHNIDTGDLWKFSKELNHQLITFHSSRTQKDRVG
jgi:hypothetical protein